MPSASSALAIVLACMLAERAAYAQSVKLLVQSSPLAGFRNGEASIVWNERKLGDRLDLVREPDNPHDQNAVRVSWRGRKLGDVPRPENQAPA